ncbi:SIS domain-containing protein [Salipaludibacillus agaradhaerens]|uniref:SIS domain-containing protein n=1 Tax=Salipaludibacillus agaradhaerens TaxID=76935 RepID=UPI000998E61C|nr:SIS domain-containing protein [Salipaludibacillus agaradhaerens]
MHRDYIDEMIHRLENLKNKQGRSLKNVGRKLAERVENGGIVHLFGAGHSHMLAEEVFYRAGGLVPVNPILEESLMLHEGAVRSSMLEKKAGYAATFLSDTSIQPEDAVIVISTSGRNPVPIDVALYAKQVGCYVVAITSTAYKSHVSSRHESGQHLCEIVEDVLHNLSPVGDTTLTHDRVNVPFASGSTVIGAAIINSVFAEAIVHLAEKGIEPPVFLSGNIDHAEEHNQSLINKYQKRIPLL